MAKSRRKDTPLLPMAQDQATAIANMLENSWGVGKLDFCHF
jgi:hypothetical protein